MHRWDAIVFFTILLSLFTMPLRIGFLLFDDWIYFLAFDVVMEITVASDIIITFYKTITEDGEVVRKRDVIRSKYLRSTFLLDLVSSLPIEYVGLFAGIEHPLWRVARMIRLQRVYGFFLVWEKNSDMKPSIIGIFKSIFIMFYCSHFSGCLFHMLLQLEPTSASASKSFSSTENFQDRPFIERYFRSLLWGLLTLTGFNQSDPQTVLQCLLQLIVSIIGIALFGAIIGNFGSLLTKLDSSRNFFQSKIDRASEYMAYKKLPMDLRNQVLHYYEYLWKTGKALESNEVIDELPDFLKTKMAFYMNSQFIRKVDMFKDVIDDVAFMQEVVSALRQRVILPNTLVVKKGEMGTEMFFVARGELNVVNDSTGTVVFTLKSESFFGEIAILYDIKRTATIVARTYCDTFVLTKGSFKKVMKKFPSQSKGIKELAKVRYQALMAKEEEAKRMAAEKAAAAEAQRLAESQERRRLEDEQSLARLRPLATTILEGTDDFPAGPRDISGAGDVTEVESVSAENDTEEDDSRKEGDRNSRSMASMNPGAPSSPGEPPAAAPPVPSNAVTAPVTRTSATNVSSHSSGLHLGRALSQSTLSDEANTKIPSSTSPDHAPPTNQTEPPPPAGATSSGTLHSEDLHHNDGQPSPPSTASPAASDRS